MLYLIGELPSETSGVIFYSALGLVFVVVALISYSIFWRPAVSRATKIELRRMLRAEHLTSLPAERSVNMTLPQSVNERPISIIVIAWIVLFSAVLSLLGSIFSLLGSIINVNAVYVMMAKTPIPVPVQYLMLFAGVIISVVSAIFMLGGANWARLLYICWGAFSCVIAFFNSPAKLLLIPGVVFYLIFVFFLLRPKASAYFTQRNGVKTT